MNRNRLYATLPAATLALVVVAATAPVAQTAGTAAKLAGQVAYRKQCSVCHGEKGEGSRSYSKQLIGDRSATALAGYISRSMPPGSPAKRCSSSDAKLIAGFIYDAFYSPIAQARNMPAHFTLSRLTVRQYRNTVADLLGSFGSQAVTDASRGLQAQYYKIGRPDGGNKVIERVDPGVHFSYGTATPAAAVPDPYQFAMEWRGSVYAPDTGQYDFIVRTEHATQLWVNDMRTPIIDALVKSGDTSEYHSTLFLIGGRWYPIQLMFAKGVTGVDNLAKVKSKPPLSASISLEWQRPKQATEVIPERWLMPKNTPPVYIPSTPFPPDDRSIGYERGTSVTKAWEEAETSCALDAASYVNKHLRELSGVSDDAKDREQRLKEFCGKFAERAFRRPLTPELSRIFIDKQFTPGQDLATSVKRVVVLTLTSPRFLYSDVKKVESDPYGYDVASRLSYSLLDSPPDRDLMQAAGNRGLDTSEQVEKQAERLLNDPRAWAKLREFFLLWLKVDQVPDLAKDPKQYPDFDSSVATDLRTSLELELKDIALGERSDYRDLFLSNKLFLNGRLAKIYGANLPQDAAFQQVNAQPGERNGVLTHPYLLSTFAYLKGSSPIHRGVLIYRNLLGRILDPPPAAFAPLAADLHPDLTTRQRVELQTKPAFCNGCHSLINPVGYTLEKYDAIGRVRTTDNGKPVDCSGNYITSTGEKVAFANPAELARYIANSPDAHRAFVEKLFQFLVKQPVRAYGSKTLPETVQYFEANDCSIRKLIVQIAVQTALKR